MRATVMYGAGDVQIETVPDAGLVESTDAVVRVTRAAICGSDLWPYKSMQPSESGRRMGHEFIGIVEDAGTDVRTVKIVLAGGATASPASGRLKTLASPQSITCTSPKAPTMMLPGLRSRWITSLA